MKDRKFWQDWHWIRVRKAKKDLKAADLELANFSGSYDVTKEDAAEEEGRSLINRWGECDDDLALLDQEKLLRSARFWRVRIPSMSDKEAWGKFAFRYQCGKLTEKAAHEIRERIRERWLMAFGVVVGLSSIVQATYAVLAYHFPR